jgi:Spy/CpxP family protein refolding chaperone
MGHGESFPDFLLPDAPLFNQPTKEKNMPTVKQPLIASLAVLTFVASMALAAPVRAADDDSMTDTAPAAADTATPSAKPAAPHMQQYVEEHIKKLHDKLKITADQETQWGVVAQTMRDNESAIHALIEERHANAKSLNAVEDLESYEKIADEHADGLKKLIPAFKTLYDAMSDDQKKNADTVFGRYEGHMAHKKIHGK